MIYRLYIYNTKAVDESAPAIGYINLALRKYYTELWKEYDVANVMEYFDVEKVKFQIESELQDKCKVFVHYPPGGYEQKGYLCIVTSYDRIHEALPRIHAIAMENGLALYDAEARKCFFKSLVNSSLVLLRTRSQTLVRIISKKMTRVWKIRKIYEFPEDNFMSNGYVITLKKDIDKTFQERVKNFYNCLKNGLRDDEELKCDKEAFIVSGKQYSITFCLEGYKKYANMKGFYMNGLPSQALLRRMSIEQAFKWIENCSDIEEKDIQSRMHFAEMEEKFPNPADRFVESVNITKWQRKQIFSIRYSGFGYYGSEILFHIVPDDFYKDTARISVLKIEEESASYILPFIHDVYPYFYERYWLTENHLPTEMWRKIIERIKEAKNLILYNTYCPELKQYINEFNLFVLSNNYEEDLTRIKNRPIDFVYDHRYEITNLLDVFIQWSEIQLDYYERNGEQRMFNIQGP